MNNASFTRQAVPTQLKPGQTFTAALVFKNTGTSSWSAAQGYRLGSESPLDNSTFGVHRINLPATGSIKPGSSKTFTAKFTAPQTPGTYSFQWRMVRDNVEWFGASSTLKSIVVASATPPPPPTALSNNASFTSQSVPTQLKPGEKFTATLVFKNTGTTSWTAGEKYVLGSQSPQDNFTFGVARLNLSSTGSIKPGSSKTFTGTFTAPQTPGTYNFQWRMVREYVEWFGATSTLKSIVVASATPPPPPPPVTPPPTSNAGRVRLWRLWNQELKDHLYTTSESERSLAVTQQGYVIEDEIIYVYSTSGDGRIPLYRYWNKSIGDHFYTTLGGGKDITGYLSEGIAAYVYKTRGDNRVRLFRLWSEEKTDHFYTTRASSATGYVHENSESIWVEDNFEVYNMYYKEYTSTNNDLPSIRQWTNMAVASTVDQVKLVVASGFPRIVYRYNPVKDVLPVLGMETTDPKFVDAFFAKNAEVLESIRSQLIANGHYHKITDMYIADEPALNRHIYKDQAFLNKYTTQVKSYFSDKKIWEVFAQRTPDNPHLSVPPDCDVVMIDPYLRPYEIPVADIENGLYNHSNSAINWALQWNKPIVLVGDAMIRNGKTVRYDLPRRVYQVARAEPAIIGMIWFVYDKSFIDGDYRGAGTDQNFIREIRSFRDVP